MARADPTVVAVLARASRTTQVIGSADHRGRGPRRGERHDETDGERFAHARRAHHRWDRLCERHALLSIKTASPSRTRCKPKWQAWSGSCWEQLDEAEAVVVT